MTLFESYFVGRNFIKIINASVHLKYILLYFILTKWLCDNHTTKL